MTDPVEIEQTLAERNVAADLAVAREAEHAQPVAQRAREIALAADDESPARVTLAQQRERVGEQERVLLGVEAADAEQLERWSGVVAARALAGTDVTRRDERDGGGEHRGGRAVTPREVRADGDDGRPPGERAPAGFECAGRDVQAQPARVAVADVCREVLTDAEHQAPPSQPREHSQGNGVRMGAERPDHVGVAERAPGAHERARPGAQHRERLGEAAVVRQGDEADGMRHAIPGGTLVGGQAPEQRELVGLLRERGEEQHEGAFAVDGAVTTAVDVVGVDEEAHPRSARPGVRTVSVLVPVRNEALHLDETVPTILRQGLDGGGEIEFLFIEGRSTDDTRAILLRFAARDPRVRLLDNPSGTIPDALNVGLAHARGEFVGRMDAHCRYPRRYLADGIARLRRGDVAWVAGPMVPQASGGASGAIALALCSRLGQGPSRRLSRDGGADAGEQELDTGVFCGVWRREVLLRFGGWEPRWIRNQDSEMAARFLAAGERIVSLPGLACDYLPRRSLRALFGQYHGYGRYRTYTAIRHPTALRGSHALPPGLVIAAPVAALAPAPARTAARAALASYATAVCVETARAVREHPPATDIVRLPPAFLAMHIGFGLGVLRGLVACALSPTHGPPA